LLIIILSRSLIKQNTIATERRKPSIKRLNELEQAVYVRINLIHFVPIHGKKNNLK